MYGPPQHLAPTPGPWLENATHRLPPRRALHADMQRRRRRLHLDRFPTTPPQPAVTRTLMTSGMAAGLITTVRYNA